MKTIKPRRAVDLAKEHIRDAILSGTFPEGSTLPPERQFSEELGINRLTLRAAISHLESEGLVQPKHGKGIVVLDKKRHGRLDLMAHIKDKEALAELFSLRRNLAAEAVAMACEKANAKEIIRLRSIARKQEEMESPEAFLEGDLKFTRAMVAASKSLPLILLFNTMETITRSSPDLPMRMLKDRKAACASYYALIALIRNRDPELGRKAVMGHLNEREEERFQAALSAD